MLQGVLHEEESVLVFILITVLLGGWLAWMTGRALALGWRGPAQVVGAIVGLACAVRFIHFALFGATLLTPHYFIVDFLVLLAFGLTGHRYTRAAQMTTQYRWLYERAGPLGWRPRSAA